MSTQLAEILLNDSPNKYNLELTDFIKRNLELIIVKGNIRFKFRIVKPKELDEVHKSGIKRLPAMKFLKKNYIGVPVIIEILREVVKNSKTCIPKKTEVELLDEYYKTQMDVKKNSDGKHIVPKEEEDDDENKVDFESAVAKETARRTASIKGVNKKEPPKKASQASKQSDDDYEDDGVKHTTKLDIDDDPMKTFKGLSSNDDGDDLFMQQLLQKTGQD